MLNFTILNDYKISQFDIKYYRLILNILFSYNVLYSQGTLVLYFQILRSNSELCLRKLQDLKSSFLNKERTITTWLRPTLPYINKISREGKSTFALHMYLQQEFIYIFLCRHYRCKPSRIVANLTLHNSSLSIREWLCTYKRKDNHKGSFSLPKQNICIFFSNIRLRLT